jgi:hypothetical protein
MDNEQSLEQELAALQHELRRVNDGIERNRTADLERRAGLLRENISLCESDLKRLESTLQSAGNKA